MAKTLSPGYLYHDNQPVWVDDREPTIYHLTPERKNEMKLHTKGEIERILRMYNADHDMGPDCPVTWREERLANAVLELREDLEELEMKVSALMDAVPSANRMSK
jgi:hypothetical protein